MSNVERDRPTGPELVMDLLVADGGVLSSAALCRAGTLFGLDERVMRVALTRLLAQAKIERTGRGCYAARREGPGLTQAVDRWQRRHAQQVPWDGAWVAVIDGDVRQADKTDWRHHALALDLRGFRTLGPGLKVRPDNLHGGVGAERERLRTLGLSAHAAVAGLAQLDAPTERRARALWDGAGLAAQYTRLAGAVRKSAAGLPRLPDDRAVHETLLLGRAVIATLLRDPLLPQALMNPAARERLAVLMRGYQADARTRWRRWLAQTMA